MTAPKQTNSESRKLKTIAFLLLYVPIVAVVLPGLLLWGAGERWKLGLGSLSYLGLVLAVAAVVVYFYCLTWLTASGAGSPAPLSATREFVDSGPYLLIRNPMYVAAISYFAGAAIFLDSGALLCFAGFMILAYY